MIKMRILYPAGIVDGVYRWTNGPVLDNLIVAVEFLSKKFPGSSTWSSDNFGFHVRTPDGTLVAVMQMIRDNLGDED